MASVSTDPNGNRTVQFVGPDRKRRSIRLGKVPLKAANEVRARVEALVAARITDTALDADTARWVAGVSVALARRLATVGLVGPRIGATTLGPFLDQYLTGRTDVKRFTWNGMDQARKRLLDVFDPATPLRDITPADADRWVILMRGKYAEATAARMVKRARQFFAAAQRARLVTDNPFQGIKPGSMKNPERLYYVTPDMAAKLIDACPDADWRAIVALCRWGGLRCPSEVVALTWADVDWDRGRFLVRASKTEHHEHRGLRWVPLFPELRPHLEALWDRAEPGAVHVITRYRLSSQNLRTTFLKIILRAGLVPWPRVIQNLRATRETELARDYPLHVVTAWIGNSQAIAAKHYLQVTDDDFERAVQNPVQQPTAGERKGVKPGGLPGPQPAPLAAGCIPAHPDAYSASAPCGGRTTSPNEPADSDLRPGPPAGGAQSGAVPSSPTLDQLADLVASLSPDERARLAELLRGEGRG
jgi:integrase